MRLIDVDELHAEISKWPDGVMYKDWVQSAIATAPTVPVGGDWVNTKDRLPEERYKCRYADDNGVCSKCSKNGEIIYCVEGPCPYMFDEVRDDGTHIEP